MNEEFARIQEEEDISIDSHVTIEKMEQVIGAIDRTVKRYLKEFQDAGILKRVGSDTSGEWILL